MAVAAEPVHAVGAALDRVAGAVQQLVAAVRLRRRAFERTAEAGDRVGRATVPPVGLLIEEAFAFVGGGLAGVGLAFPAVRQVVAGVGVTFPAVRHIVTGVGLALAAVREVLPDVGFALAAIREVFPGVGFALAVIGEAIPRLGACVPQVGVAFSRAQPQSPFVQIRRQARPLVVGRVSTTHAPQTTEQPRPARLRYGW
ncbi:hypothetical protein AB0M36_32385 [Actinoplanes sp. NPDC051346]|uniref:hypothetical protein n=1 Tax=Actinoplanes sp. NPDC051346 TaxID=3155048 RepID=UPI003420CF8F